MSYKVKHGKCLLSKRLKDLGMTQQDLADKSGIDKSTISRYANDRVTMTIDSAVSIARALGCRVEDLYKWIPAD